VLAVLLAGCAAPPRRVAKAPSPAPVPHPAKPVRLTGLPIAPPAPFPQLVAAQRPAIDLLIEKVQQDFREGEKDYQAGRLPEARKKFDGAIHLLMDSGLNFSSDPRLEPLMDRLVGTLHEYQMKVDQEGMEAGSIDQEQEEEAPQPGSPIEEINKEVVGNLPPNPEVDQKAASELLHVPHDLPLTVNQQVLNFLSYFQTSRGQKIIEHSLARSGRYRAMVRRVLKEEGVPQDLMYLPLPESGYQPRALSRKGARGLWQFMPATGRLYGLKINRWEDQRMDPEVSTRAAAEHLRDLYQIFHDWYLVLAAYDSGPLTVARAIERTGYADFWQLYRLNALPAETRNYVPIMLAMTMVAKDPALYGVNVNDPEPALRTDSFQPGHQIDLRLVADAIGVKVDEMRDLNPALTGVVTPEDDPDFALRVPAGKVRQLRTTLASIPESRWVGWRLYRAEAGETLGGVAEHFHVRLASLAEANDLSSNDPLTAGKVLLVPAPPLHRVIYYRVRSGDTIGRIAGRYRVSVSNLRLWNHLRSNLIRVGQHLRIYTATPAARFEQVSNRRRVSSSRSDPSESAPRDSHGRATHTVHSGDTFWDIARRYGTSVAALRAANPRLAREGLKPGDRVVIPEH
jgi:membrane-bound lytic murein transglycosylase D